MTGISESNSQKIKNLSFICAILVVTIHISWPADSLCLTWGINQVVKRGIANIAVPFFFVVSGYFLAAHFDDRNWWKQEIRKRIYSLVVPFLVWSILFLCASIIKHQFFDTGPSLSEGEWMRVFGLQLDTYPRLVPLWYVRCLFFFVIAAPLFKFMVEKLGFWWLLGAFAVSTAFSLSPAYDTRTFWQGFLRCGFSLSGVFFFSVGVYIKRFAISFESRRLATISAIYGLGFLIVRTYVRARGCEIPTITGFACTPALLFCAWYITPARKWPTWLTSCSFPIYLMHATMIATVDGLLWHCSLGKQTTALTTWVVVIIVPIVVTNILHRFAPKVARFLFAGRSQGAS